MLASFAPGGVLLRSGSSASQPALPGGSTRLVGSLRLPSIRKRWRAPAPPSWSPHPRRSMCGGISWQRYPPSGLIAPHEAKCLRRTHLHEPTQAGQHPAAGVKCYQTQSELRLVHPENSLWLPVLLDELLRRDLEIRLQSRLLRFLESRGLVLAFAEHLVDEPHRADAVRGRAVDEDRAALAESPRIFSKSATCSFEMPSLPMGMLWYSRPRASTFGFSSRLPSCSVRRLMIVLKPAFWMSVSAASLGWPAVAMSGRTR